MRMGSTPSKKVLDFEGGGILGDKFCVKSQAVE